MHTCNLSTNAPSVTKMSVLDESSLKSDSPHATVRSPMQDAAASIPSPQAPQPPSQPSKRRLWAAKEQYDPNQFYVNSTDEKGHGGTTRVLRVPPSILQQIEALVESHEFPGYKTKDAFIRDAIVHRLNYIKDNTGSESLRLSLEQEIARLHLEEVTRRYEQELTHFTRLSEQIESVCEKAIAAGDLETLRMYLDRLRDDIASYREPFRTMIVELADRYISKCAD